MDRLAGCALALLGLSLAGCGRSPPPAPAAAPEVNVYNWAGYIAPGTVPAFERSSGIKVTYEEFERSASVEDAVRAGGAGHDVLVPSLHFIGRASTSGLFRRLEASRLPHLAQLDPQLMELIARQDPGELHGVPYMWGTIGVGYNVQALEERLGPQARVDSWDIIFKPELVSRFSDCGVTLLDAPGELIPIALHYLGADPGSTDPAQIERAAALLRGIRPYVSTFQSTQYIEALASGRTCLVVGWSGDVVQARNRALDDGRGVQVAYAIPREGAPLYVDMLTIPRDAVHVDQAYAFIDMLLQPEVAARNSEVLGYANPVPASLALMSAQTASDPAIYPPADERGRLFPLPVLDAQTDRRFVQVWEALKAAR